MSDRISVLDKLGLSIGYTVSHEKNITEDDIAQFARVSGDFNPVHISEDFARQTLFRGRIAHGALSQAFLSAAMAKLPGLVIFISQQVRFLRPVRIGDTITARAEVLEMDKTKDIVTLKNTCFNQKGEIIVEGQATVKLYEKPA